MMRNSRLFFVLVVSCCAWPSVRALGPHTGGPVCTEAFICTEDPDPVVPRWSNLFGILRTVVETTYRVSYEQDGQCVDSCENAETIRAWRRLQTVVCGTCEGDKEPPVVVVDPADVTLVPSNVPAGAAIVSSITGYNWRASQNWDDESYELPIYDILDRDQPEFWTYLVDELLLSRQHLVLLHGRGCWDLDDDTSTAGTGNMCPRSLTGFVDACDRAGVRDVIKVGMWDDTGMYRTARNKILGTNDTQFDVSDESNWVFFWDHNIKIWFDTVPSDLWFRMDDGRPVIANWNLRDNKFSNQADNASRLLAWLKANFLERYGVEPYFILEETWTMEDPSILDENLADGEHGWFNPLVAPFSYVELNGHDYGVLVPGFRTGGSVPPCGVACREITRQGGKTLQDGLDAAPLGTTEVIILEGWTNMVESAGFYRSLEWTTSPNQYINAIRDYSDPEPETLWFQAEGADTYFDTTPDVNIGGDYSTSRGLDVAALTTEDTGWYVGWTDPGEWLEYQAVQLGCGRYRFTARAATTMEGNQIRLTLGDLPSVTVPVGGEEEDFSLVHLGEVSLPSLGKYDLRIEFITGETNLDWFFVKRIDTSGCA